MRVSRIVAILPLLSLAIATGAVGQAVEGAGAKAGGPGLDPAREADALAFVREHHPELATVVEALKPKDPAEYRKAILELSLVGRNLAEVKARNPKRYPLALDAWNAKSRVELLAARLAGSPDEERRSQLRSAIEAQVEAEIRLRHFALEQAEAAAKKARAEIDRLEGHRDSIVESRLRALQPRKAARGKKPASPPKAPATTPADPAKPHGEDR